MILVDAVFLIEYFYRYYKKVLVSEDDPIFNRPEIRIFPDLWMVENQLPFFILNDLFDLAKSKTDGEFYDGLTLIELLDRLIHSYTFVEESLIHQENLIETCFSKAKHLLDFLRLYLLQPPELPSQNLSKHEILLNLQNIPTVTELHQAGVKLMCGSGFNLFDITFNNGILKIPVLFIASTTEGLLRNLLLELERANFVTSVINDYVVMMNYLVNTPKDVELLMQNVVIRNWLVDSEAVSTLFHNLREQTNVVTGKFQYSALVKNLKAYSKNPCHRWKANLKQNYFNTPWASISVVAAVLLLILTLTQTVCSIISL